LIGRKILGEQYRSLTSSSCGFLHYPFTASFLGLNILLHILFSKTLSQHSSLNVSDQASHKYKTTGKFILHQSFLDWPGLVDIFVIS
jgi:hypothetical protein